MRISLLLLPALGIILLTLEVHESDAIYPYAVKGFVQDVRHKPHLFIGAWALKKFIKLKLIKLKFKLAKKLLIKKKIKVKLILFLLKKIKRKAQRHLHGRKRRQVQDYVPYSPQELNEDYEYYEQQELPGGEPTDEEMMAYLSMATELDSQSCLPKGVCEVVARGNGTHLNHFENMVYDTYGNGERPKSVRESPTYVYEYAAYIGKTSRDGRECERLFKSCQESPKALNTFMDSTFTSEMCEVRDDQIQISSEPESSYYVSDQLSYYSDYHEGPGTQPESYLQQSQNRLKQQHPQIPQRPTGVIKFENH